MEHTPGPWEAHGMSVYAGDLPVAAVTWCGMTDCIDDDEWREFSARSCRMESEAAANARLIAAAPELFNALYDLAAVYHHKNTRDDYDRAIKGAKIALINAGLEWGDDRPKIPLALDSMRIPHWVRVLGAVVPVRMVLDYVVTEYTSSDDFLPPSLVFLTPTVTSGELG